MKNFLIFISVLFVVFGMVLSVVFFVIISGEKTYGSPLDMPTTGQVGDFIGGVIGTTFSLAGTILLILTLTQQSHFQFRENFESKFFKLLELQRAQW